ncbi:putative peptidase thermolysin protein [Zalerion maritima]|uniref:Peptidase thermolysin protein n=1 Tax=Zalerion maritima TaxID=339359 RepID=A0AAD5RG25_9PEZI|nr:putative peptidase thermolysin protein [Zalerion maritima]
MCGNKCYIAPPHLVQALAQNSEGQEMCDHYKTCLEHQNKIRAARTNRFDFLCKPRGERRDAAIAAARAAGKPEPKNFDRPPSTKRSIVPAEILRHIAESDTVNEETRACATKDLEHVDRLHQRVIQRQQAGPSAAAASGAHQDEGKGGKISSLMHRIKKPKTEKSEGGQVEEEEDDEEEPTLDKFYRAVYDAENSMNEQDLPGKKVRVEGEDPVEDKAINQAYSNAGEVLKFYKEKFGWNSIDNKNMAVISSCHFGNNYGNAFWDPDKQQMVYGDGDNFLHKFTECVDVIGHEMTHAVTEYTSPLDYQGQPGALNEHVSDVFGIMVKQMVEDEKAKDADWLIGEGCLLPGIKGVALRSMKNPGTAYNDKVLGKDPQPDNFKDYKVITEDNGGVHIYSGIPNKAFYKASVDFGGYSWEKAGLIWWKTMNSGRIPPRCTFKQFAQVTIEIAEEEFKEEGKKVLTNAWEEVGVEQSSTMNVQLTSYEEQLIFMNVYTDTAANTSTSTSAVASIACIWSRLVSRSLAAAVRSHSGEFAPANNDYVTLSLSPFHIISSKTSPRSTRKHLEYLRFSMATSSPTLRALILKSGTWVGTCCLSKLSSAEPSEAIIRATNDQSLLVWMAPESGDDGGTLSDLLSPSLAVFQNLDAFHPFPPNPSRASAPSSVTNAGQNCPLEPRVERYRHAHGASHSAQQPASLTPADYAAISGDLESLKILLENGGRVLKFRTILIRFGLIHSAWVLPTATWAA